MKLITKEYHEQLITFDLDDDLMINLTEMAKQYGRRPNDFLELEQTKAFLEELANPLSCFNTSQNGNETKQYVITKHGGNDTGTWIHRKLAIKAAAWLDPKFEVWMINQIEELMTTGKVSIATNYEQALTMLGVAAEIIQIVAPVFYQRDDAIRTKAEIGSRREATAMQTASAATRKVNNLEIELDKNHHWATILKVQQVTGIKYDWVALKDYMTAHGIPIKKIDSGVARFAAVNSYHADAWHNVYNVDITEFRTC